MELKTIKLLEENIGNKIVNTSLWSWEANKINKWDYIRKKKLFATRETTNKTKRQPLARWFSWLEHCSIHQKAVGLIPGQGVYRRQLVDVSLSH